MKVFWSWQGDTPQSTGRHLVREALAEAISRGAGGGVLFEARREEICRGTRSSPHGPPETGRRIFRQIRECDIFVADLTVPGPGEGTPGRVELCNPDVAIELGYFRAVNGSAGLIVVVNTAFSRKSPSLRHPGGALLLVVYDLPDGSGAREVGRERKALTEKIGYALRECGGPPAMPPGIGVGAAGPETILH